LFLSSSSLLARHNLSPGFVPPLAPRLPLCSSSSPPRAGCGRSATCARARRRCSSAWPTRPRSAGPATRRCPLSLTLPSSSALQRARVGVRLPNRRSGYAMLQLRSLVSRWAIGLFDCAIKISRDGLLRSN
jgi:hypothetical protein